jgi:NAD-dependent protein deacetylase/lipoamidase
MESNRPDWPRNSQLDQTAQATARELIAQANYIVAFTGAGISAESGIPTYRDNDDALWENFDPQQVVQIDRFLSDSTPFWNFFRDYRYQAISGASPNEGHRALAVLEDSGKLKSLITQNIDGLHQAAGSRQVIEIHGNTRRIGCLDCDAEFGMDEVFEQLKRELPPPCRSCGGRLKPKVVFFGEQMPLREMTDAVKEVQRCDLLIAVGSSLQVYPAASLPELAKNNGARVMIVNKTMTPFDQLSDAVVPGNAAEILPIIIA